MTPSPRFSNSTRINRCHVSILGSWISSSPSAAARCCQRSRERSVGGQFERPELGQPGVELRGPQRAALCCTTRVVARIAMSS